MQSFGTVGTGPALKFLQPEGPGQSDDLGQSSTVRNGLLPRRRGRHMSKSDCCMDSSDRIWIYFLFVLNLLLNIHKNE